MSEFPWQDYRFPLTPAANWVQHGGRRMNEIKGTFECIQLNLLFSYVIYLYTFISMLLNSVWMTNNFSNAKQDFQIRFTGMESRFSLEATLLYWDQYVSVCLTE